ncbi:zinc finger, CCHC-type containing protein [Tanacetum coccineum]
MASMKYCDKHNQVGFLKKPKESVVFAEIVNFLKGSHIRYALSHNPTIHDSLVKQFWQTATATTIADGTLELRATIDTREYTITEASVRSKLQLADASGISMLPNTKMFEGMGNIGYPADGTFTLWKSHFTPQWRFLVHYLLHCMSPKSGGWDQFGSNLATALICLSTGRIYNFSKLIFDGMCGNLKSKTKFLMYPQLLQNDFEKQTENIKHPYLAIVLTKKIFGNMKRGFRGVLDIVAAMVPVVVDQREAQEEEISPTTLEAAKTLSKVASQRTKSVDKDISSGFEEINTGGLGVSTGSRPVSSDRGQREGKAPMIIEETQAPKRTKEQIQQEEASLAEAIRLQTLEEEETAKQVHLDALLAKRLAEEETLSEQQKKRKAQVQFEAQFYTKEDWDTIRAKLEANAELKQDVLGKDLPEQDFAKRMVDLNQGTWKLSQLKKLTFEEIKEEFDKVVKQVESFVPMNIEATKAQLKRYREELQTEISKKQRIDDKDVSVTKEEVAKVKEEEPAKRIGKRKKLVMQKYGTNRPEDAYDRLAIVLQKAKQIQDFGEADIILGIKIKCENKGIVITQSHYIEKILKKFNREDCSPVSIPMDLVEKLKPNTVGWLSRFTSNSSRQHWHAITRVFKYLKGTMNYGLSYVGYPSVLEAYSDASWINHVEDSSSTSGWVFLLGGGAISWASKKQTCITGSTMESEFVALAAAGKEAEWLRNLIHEIPIWPKPIAPISIRCDSAATLAKAYSQIYNGKSRHLGVRHSMIRELIRNGVISIEFVRSQHNLADHLTKGLARDLVIKCKTKRTTYVNMKFCRFKKLGLGFLYVH